MHRQERSVIFASFIVLTTLWGFPAFVLIDESTPNNNKAMAVSGVFPMQAIAQSTITTNNQTNYIELDEAISTELGKYNARPGVTFNYEELDRNVDINNGQAVVYVTRRDKISSEIVPGKVDIIIALHQENGWVIAIPGDENYATLFEQLTPSFVLSINTEPYEPQANMALVNPLALDEYLLPWSHQHWATVTRSYETGHGTGQIDFDIDDGNLNAVAAKGGTIIYVNDSHTINTYSSGAWWYWNTVVIRHANNEYTLYAHLAHNSVPQWIKSQCSNNYNTSNCSVSISAGQIIGIQGSVGQSSSPHLHISSGQSFVTNSYTDTQDEDQDGNRSESIHTGYVWTLQNIAFQGYTTTQVGSWGYGKRLQTFHPSASVDGSVTIQYRGYPPNERLHVPLHVTLITDNASPTIERDTFTGNDGRFSIGGIPPGTYLIRVKSPNTLSRAQIVNLVAGTNPVNMDELHVGDAENTGVSFDRIDIFDYVWLVKEFGARSQSGNCVIYRRSDFDADCDTDIYDYSYFVGNFGEEGATSNQVAVVNANAGALFGLRASPSSAIKTVGEEFDVNIEVAVPNDPAVGAQVFLNFDPSILQVVSITPGTILPDVLVNQVDNRTGQIDFAAGRRSDSYPKGVFTVMTIRFRVVGATSGTVLAFNLNSQRETVTTSFGGNGVLEAIENGFIITSAVNGAPFMNYYATGTPTLTWNRISWATSYEVQVARDLAFADIVYSYSGTDLETTVTPALADGVYYWHVRATGSSWSTTQSFTVH